MTSGAKMLVSGRVILSKSNFHGRIRNSPMLLGERLVIRVARDVFSGAREPHNPQNHWVVQKSPKQTKLLYLDYHKFSLVAKK